jgi:ubiquinone/menaquinone biosynthesis C-methylase UbiE
MQEITPSRYALGDSEREIRRLILQGEIYRPATREFLQAAGIAAGMSVLDLGSGAGDVSFILSEMVGPTGRVFGVDMSEAMVETARARAAALGSRNLEFVAGKLEEFETDRRFDAITGRWILRAVGEPANLLRGFVRFLKPGGIVAISDLDISIPPWPYPEVPPSLKPIVPLLISLESAPAQNSAWLSQVFLEAGLPRPELRLSAPIGGGPDWPGYEYLTETLRSLAPSYLARGWDMAGVDVDTLADRLREEVTTANAVLRLGAIIGAWARRP